MPLNPLTIRNFTHRIANENLTTLEVFAEIESTNSYLLEAPAPLPGKMRVVLTDNQTAGRGQRGNPWQSPPASGLCISAAFRYALPPENLSSLTLALGLSVANALDSLGAQEVCLKWPNDLVARDGKLGGILTELRSTDDNAVTIVAGVGINVDLPQEIITLVSTGRVMPVVDLAGVCAAAIDLEELAGAVVSGWYATFTEFEANGFESFLPHWESCDWLLGRAVTVALPTQQVSGVAAGIDSDGALLLAREDGSQCRVTSGSIVAAGSRISTKRNQTEPENTG